MTTLQNITPEEMYTQLYAVYFPKLVRFSQNYLFDFEDAENLVQDIFLYLWEHKDLLPSIENKNAFLFTMVKNRCIDLLRKQTQWQQDRKHELSDLDKKELEFNLYSLQQFDEANLSESELEEIIQNAIDSLPERCREIFRLSRLEGLKYKEIASRLNISVNTVEGQMGIALKKLKIALKNYIPLFIFII